MPQWVGSTHTQRKDDATVTDTPTAQQTPFSGREVPDALPAVAPSVVAQPGDDGCDLDINGLTLVHAEMSRGALGLVLTGSGHGQFIRDGAKQQAHGGTDLVIWERFWRIHDHSVTQDEWTEHLDEYQARLREWADAATPLRVTMVPGKSTLISDPHGNWLPVPRRAQG